MKNLLLAVLMLVFVFGCGSGGGGSSDKNDDCSGPVRCLTENWGNQYAVFYDIYNKPVLLVSNGERAGIAYLSEIDHEIVIVAFEGPVKNCYKANMYYGGIDFDLDGIIDVYLSGVTGMFKVCKQTLKTYNFESNEYIFDNFIAYYGYTAYLSKNALSTDAPVSAENVDKIKREIEVIKQLME